MDTRLTFLPAAALALLTACQIAPPRPAEPPAAPPPPVAAPAPPPPVAAAPAPAAPAPFGDAVLAAAHSLFSNAPMPAQRQPVLVDPLVDGATGMESNATRDMAAKLTELMARSYPQLEVLEFNADNLKRSPWVLVGTFTPINAAAQADGPKDAYRVCLALADLASGTIVSKGFARATPEAVDITPTPFYQESPTWMRESLTEGYVKTCQGTKAGDPIHPVYLDGILASSQIAEGVAAFNAGRYQDALEFHRAALSIPQGQQLRALNGIYLAQQKLGQRKETEEAFGRIVDFGLAQQRIAVKFLFRPGSTGFVSERALVGAYPMWLRQLARRSARSRVCLDLIGHASKTGPEPLNERLSLLRAETIRKRMAAIAPPLKARTAAQGAGSRQTLVGLGTDDLRDALDRRVVFSVTECPRAR